VTLSGFKIGVTKYLAYGDSVTEGQNGLPGLAIDIVDVPNAYPTKLQALLEASFPGQGTTVVNHGSGGEPVEKGAFELRDVLVREKPGALLLIDGYNNLLGDCAERDHGTDLTPRCHDEIDIVAGKMREMVRIARGAGVAYVFVGTLTPPGPYEGNITNRRIIPAAVTRTNAKLLLQLPGEGAVVVDLYPLFLGHEAEYTGPDGLHLDPPGNQVIAEAFFAAIKNTIPKTSASAVSRSVFR
jgi:lysophospholipase L1-like esterase